MWQSLIPPFVVLKEFALNFAYDIMNNTNWTCSNSFVTCRVRFFFFFLQQAAVELAFNLSNTRKVIFQESCSTVIWSPCHFCYGSTTAFVLNTLNHFFFEELTFNHFFKWIVWSLELSMYDLYACFTTCKTNLDIIKELEIVRYVRAWRGDGAGRGINVGFLVAHCYHLPTTITSFARGEKQRAQELLWEGIMGEGKMGAPHYTYEHFIRSSVHGHTDKKFRRLCSFQLLVSVVESYCQLTVDNTTTSLNFRSSLICNFINL